MLETILWVVRQGFPDAFIFKYQKILFKVWVRYGAMIGLVVVVLSGWIIVVNGKRKNRSRR